MIHISPELITNARAHYTYLHEHPELSFAEEQTAAYIRRFLDRLQIQHTDAGPTGIIGFLPGICPGQYVDSSTHSAGKLHTPGFFPDLAALETGIRTLCPLILNND